MIVSELKAAQLSAQNLKTLLKNNNADLTAISLSINKKNDFYNALLKQLNAFSSKLPPDLRKEKESIINFCNANLNIHDKLLSKQENIDKINHAFFQKLEQKHGHLSPNEKYLAGSFRLGLTNKEIAIQKGISLNSVKMGRYRLRKKFQLDVETDLVAYLQQL